MIDDGRPVSIMRISVDGHIADILDLIIAKGYNIARLNAHDGALNCGQSFHI